MLKEKKKKKKTLHISSAENSIGGHKIIIRCVVDMIIFSGWKYWYLFILRRVCSVHTIDFYIIYYRMLNDKVFDYIILVKSCPYILFYTKYK